MGLEGTAAEGVEVGGEAEGFAGTVVAAAGVGGESSWSLDAAATAVVVVEGEADFGGTAAEVTAGVEDKSG